MTSPSSSEFDEARNVFPDFDITNGVFNAVVYARLEKSARDAVVIFIVVVVELSGSSCCFVSFRIL